MKKPTPQQPWREAFFELDGERVVVSLARHGYAMHTHVFVRGRSVADGRTLADVRRSSPAAKTNYEAWIDVPTATSYAERPLLTPWIMAAGVTSLGVFAVVAIFAPIPAGPSFAVATTALVMATVALVGIWFRSWYIAVDRTHVWLLRHPELGDGKRVFGFFAVLLGYPLIIGAAVLALLGAFDAAG